VGSYAVARFVEWKLLTRRVVPGKDKRCRSAVQLRASIEDELIRWLTGVGHCAGHVVRRTVDDVVAEEVLALPESAVVRC
jgi:hypothetical protein